MGDKDRRIKRLEAAQRGTVAGLVALLEVGTLTLQQLTDDELRALVATGDGPLVDMTIFTDDELRALARK